MNLSSTKRPILLGLALGGAAGAAAIITFAVSRPSASQAPLAAPAPQSSVAAAVTSIAPAAAAAPATSGPAPVTLDQARAIAEHAGNGQADKIETDTGPAGISYEVSVIRADGTDVELIVDARTGRILSNIAEQQDPQEQSDAPDPQDSSD
jgi:hypothetical protein